MLKQQSDSYEVGGGDVGGGETAKKMVEIGGKWPEFCAGSWKQKVESLCIRLE